MKQARPFLSIDKRLVADSATSDDAARNLFYLCDRIGSRFAGTDGYRQAAEFMLDRFKSYRLQNAHLEAFELDAWRRGEPARLGILSPVVRSCPCYELPYGAATGQKGVKARLVDVGGGSAEECKAVRGKLKGRLVLTDGSSGHRTEIYARCVAEGAAGFILGNRAPGMLLQTGSVYNDGGAIPAVCVGSETVAELQRLAKIGPVRLHLVTDSACEPAPTWNVVGELRGSEHPDELVIMGGHLDSHDISPGAFDNGAGAVMVAESARLLAKHRKHLKRTVRFICFAGEEVGLLGSHYHAKAHATELRKARFMLNCDTPALGRPRGLAFHKCPKAKPYMQTLAEEMQTEILCQDRAHCHSDHYPFILQGVPTAGVAGGPEGASVNHYVHMAADTPEKIPLSDLRDAASFAARMLLRAANDERWPLRRRSAAEVKKWREMGQPDAS